MANLKAARHQLYLLTGEADPVVNWQVFCDHDHDRKDLARSYRGTLTMLAPALLAAQQQGCGVFVAVNEFDGTRRKENLFAIRALFLDFDAAPLPERWPVMPDLVLNTSITNGLPTVRKHQCLWLLSPTTEVPLWRCLQRSLQERYGADKHCRGNTCQVMRVAGFQHLKQYRPGAIGNPHTVQTVHAAKHPALNDVKLLAAMFGVVLKPEREQRAERSKIDVPASGWDSPADIATVTRILSNPDNWNLTPNGGGIYKIACLCRDFGLSPETATDIMEQHCPIGFADMSHIADKVAHAYEYATGEAGSRSFAAALEKVDKEELDFSKVVKEDNPF